MAKYFTSHPRTNAKKKTCSSIKEYTFCSRIIQKIFRSKEKSMSPILKFKEIDPEGMYLKKGLNYDLLMGKFRLDNFMGFMRRFYEELRALFNKF